MDRYRAVESGEARIRQKHSPSVQYGDRAPTRYSISRPRSSRTASPLIQPINPDALAKRFTQLKDFSTEISRSFVRYPYMWLAATWIVLVFTGGVATVILFKIAPMEPERSIASTPVENFASTPLPDRSQNEPDPNSPQPEPQQESSLNNQPRLIPKTEQKERLPLFALGTVAFSCAIGCLWLSYRLTSRPPQPQPRFPSRTPRLPRSTPTAQRSLIRTTEPDQATNAAMQPREVRSNSADVSTATVAILSSHESHPLDWDEPSLADNLDIRQQRPLSHWL